MNSVLGFETVNDVVILAIISNAFWLIIFLVCVFGFRSEIRSLLSSLSSFNIAGSRFELGGKLQTFKSYSILSNIFLEVLSDRANAEKFVPILSEVNAQELTQFTMKYLLEAPKEEINFPLIRNVAYIAGRRGRLQDSLSLYQFLTEKAPDDIDIINDKATLLLSKNPSEAEKIYKDLMDKNPGIPTFKYNHALANITLDNYDDGIKELELLMREGFSDPNMLDRPAIQKLARVKPEEYGKLLALSKGEEQDASK